MHFVLFLCPDEKSSSNEACSLHTFGDGIPNPKIFMSLWKAKTRLRRRKALRILLASQRNEIYFVIFLSPILINRVVKHARSQFSLRHNLKQSLVAHTSNENFAVFVINTMQFEMTFAALVQRVLGMQCNFIPLDTSRSLLYHGKARTDRLSTAHLCRN